MSALEAVDFHIPPTVPCPTLTVWLGVPGRCGGTRDEVVSGTVCLPGAESWWGGGECAENKAAGDQVKSCWGHQGGEARAVTAGLAVGELLWRGGRMGT